jgi:hypothetical protein
LNMPNVNDGVTRRRIQPTPSCIQKFEILKRTVPTDGS